ncbi:MAG: alginate lyase family protein [Pseudodesulfovibrio sp.]|nr:alginate lyase family protein [Pseudodesulfovibrio sp.]
MIVSGRTLLSVALLLLIAVQANAGRNLPDTIVLSPEVLYENRQRVFELDPALMPAFDKLISEAELAVNAPAEAVVLKPGPGPGNDMHDYWSIAPYWWPNPKTPDGLPYVHRDGERNPEADSDKYDRMRMHRMSRDALTLALAWYLTGNEQYAGKGTGLIWSWCIDSVTRTNPNMQHAQARPENSEGQHSGIVETRDLIRVIDAARILEPSHSWSTVVTRKLTAWFSEYAKWLRHSDFGKQEASSPNNHGTWFDAQLAVYAMYTGDTDFARSMILTTYQRRIVRQINPDGSMPRELERTRPRHYTFFNLEALFVLAAVAERLDIDLWHETDTKGPSIRKAFDFAAPYIDPKKPWPNGKTGAFNPFAFTPLFHRAAVVYKDGRYLEFMEALPADKLKQDRANLFY